MNTNPVQLAMATYYYTHAHPLNRYVRINDPAVNMDYLKEELDEFRQAVKHESKERQQAELGDILFTAINAGTSLCLSPTKALVDAVSRFRFRLWQVEQGSPNNKQEFRDLWEKTKSDA